MKAFVFNVMSLKYSLIVTNDLENEESVSDGEFSKNEHELILDFVSSANDLFQTPFIKNGNYGSYSIEQKNEEISYSVKLPNWNDAMLFIYKLRPLILQNEKTYFHNISNLLGKQFDSSFVRGFLKLQRELFTGKNYQNRIQFRSNQELLNSDEMLFNYLNGFEYHREKDKQKFIERLHVMLPLDFTKVIFLRLLIDKATAVANLADFLEVLLGKQQEIEVESKMK
jgi:hypothetical protein